MAAIIGSVYLCEADARRSRKPFAENGKNARHPLFAFVASSSCTQKMLSASLRTDLTAWKWA